MQLTLVQAFGSNASQSVNLLTINKADLPLLTPSSNNTADSLLVAILLQVLSNFQGNLTDEKGNTVTDQNNIPITYDNSNYWDEVGLNYWGKTFPNRLVRYIFLFYQYEQSTLS